MSFNIEKRLTPYNFTDANNLGRIKYIVIHYFGSLGTAASVANYFRDAYRGASAHYTLDEGETIYQCVEDADTAWHCGTSGQYFHPECRNSNSIGIEVRPYKRNTASMNAEDQDWYFTPATVDRLVEFTKYLMKKYNIPADRVIRHYDVTHKICPNPFVVNAAAQAAWVSFKNRLVATPAPSTPVATSGYIVQVTTAALNIRSGPGTQYGVVDCITDRGNYTIVDTQNGWGKLKSGAGWIALNYTTKIGSAPAPTPAPAPAPAPSSDFKVQVTADDLNIRSGPGTSYGVTGCITDHGVYTIVDTQSTWGKLKSGAGWISLNYTKRV